MKLLCVERDNWGLLRVGEIYTQAILARCPSCPGAYIGVAEYTNARKDFGWCYRCNTIITQESSYQMFRSTRFIPWNPDELGISEEEVRRLYSPQPVKVDIEPLFTISPLDYMLLEAWRRMSR